MPRVVLRNSGDVAAFAVGLKWHDRPWRIELRSPGLTREAAQRLTRDITSCGCVAGALAGLAVFALLCVFARGAVTPGLVAVWLAAIMGAGLAAKVVALLVTHWRAQRALLLLSARLRR